MNRWHGSWWLFCLFLGMPTLASLADLLCLNSDYIFTQVDNKAAFCTVQNIVYLYMISRAMVVHLTRLS